MIHFTLTGMGSNASRMLCQTEPATDDTFWHWMYCSPAQLAQPNICPACLTVLNEED
jgi:hypothetical protein